MLHKLYLTVHQLHHHPPQTSNLIMRVRLGITMVILLIKMFCPSCSPLHSEVFRPSSIPKGAHLGIHLSVNLSSSHLHPAPNPLLSSLDDYSPQISVNHIQAHPLVIPRPPAHILYILHGTGREQLLVAVADLLLSTKRAQAAALPLLSHEASQQIEMCYLSEERRRWLFRKWHRFFIYMTFP